MTAHAQTPSPPALSSAAPDTSTSTGSAPIASATSSDLGIITFAPTSISTTQSPSATNQKTQSVSSGSNVATAIVSGITMFSSAAGPAVASVASRVGVINRVDSCKPLTHSALAFYASPTFAELAIGADEAGRAVRYHVGGILGNFGIICAFPVISLLIAWIHHKWWTEPTGERTSTFGLSCRSLAFARFPGALVFPISFFAQPLVGSGVTALIVGNTGAALVGVFGLLVIGALTLHSAFVLLRGQSFLATYRKAEDLKSGEKIRRALEKPGFCKSIILCYREYIEHAYGRWFDVPRQFEDASRDVKTAVSVSKLEVAEERGDHAHWMRRYQAYFDRYTETGRWYFLVELLVSVALGIFDGMSDVIGCQRAVYAIAAIFCTYFLSVVILRPFSHRNDMVFGVLITVFMVVASVLAVVPADEIGKENGERVVMITSTFSLFVAMVQAVVNSVQDVAEMVDDWLTNNREEKEAAAESKRKAEAGGVDDDATEEMKNALLPGRQRLMQERGTAGLLDKNNTMFVKKGRGEKEDDDDDDDDDIPLPSPRGASSPTLSRLSHPAREKDEKWRLAEAAAKEFDEFAQHDAALPSGYASINLDDNSSNKNNSNNNSKIPHRSCASVEDDNKSGGRRGSKSGAQCASLADGSSSSSIRTHPRYQKCRSAQAEGNLRELEEAKANSAAIAASAANIYCSSSPSHAVPKQQQLQQLHWGAGEDGGGIGGNVQFRSAIASADMGAIIEQQQQQQQQRPIQLPLPPPLAGLTTPTTTTVKRARSDTQIKLQQLVAHEAEEEERTGTAARPMANPMGGFLTATTTTTTADPLSLPGRLKSAQEDDFAIL